MAAIAGAGAVNLLTLLDLDSSLSARKELTEELTVQLREDVRPNRTSRYTAL